MCILNSKSYYDLDCLLFSRNIVSTVNLDCKLDLKQIALQARNAEYNPKVCRKLGGCTYFSILLYVKEFDRLSKCLACQP